MKLSLRFKIHLLVWNGKERITGVSLMCILLSPFARLWGSILFDTYSGMGQTPLWEIRYILQQLSMSREVLDVSPCDNSG
jgi:hypothetical protein